MMAERNEALAGLEVFVGEWSMEARFEATPPADADGRVVFEWLTGGKFLLQRWAVSVPEAPDGIAVIGPDTAIDGRYLQHYFDSRGVARVYQMTLDDGTWTLWRDAPDFSLLEFGQRFTGTISRGGQVIEGAWEISHDGKSWQHDFDLTYTKQVPNEVVLPAVLP